MGDVPSVLYVSGSSIDYYVNETWEQIQEDPRGLLLMWEAPNPKKKYIMGLDSTEGITGWNRGNRKPSDDKTDNGAIVIFAVDDTYELMWEAITPGNTVQKPLIDPVTRKQKRRYKDVQVAEFAGPCDAVEIARVANVLGRIYAGDADDQCELIWESWPGCGLLATQELLRLGYGNLWHWEYIDSEVEETNRLGWRSTRESQKLLWYRARRHLMNEQAVIRSEFTLAEYANAEIDLDKMRARAAYGFHDDRFQACNMSFWAAHKWAYDIERTDEPVTEAPFIDYQRYAPVLGDDNETFTDWRQNATSDWE